MWKRPYRSVTYSPPPPNRGKAAAAYILPFRFSAQMSSSIFSTIAIWSFAHIAIPGPAVQAGCPSAQCSHPEYRSHTLIRIGLDMGAAVEHTVNRSPGNPGPLRRHADHHFFATLIPPFHTKSLFRTVKHSAT